MHYFAWKEAVAMAMRRPYQGPATDVPPIPTDVSYDVILHCLDCGACCQARDGTILITDEDIAKWKAADAQEIIDNIEPGHFGQMAFKMTSEHRCVFQGTDENQYACAIYGKRATICGAFEKGCSQCFDIRRNQQEFQK